MKEKICVVNAFSLSMLKPRRFNLIGIEEISDEEARTMVREVEIDSAVGHEATARVISSLLEINIPTQRKKISLEDYDRLLVFQIMQRLPEGKILNEEEIKSLPHRWFMVSLWASGGATEKEAIARALYECV